jgi:hypothetical protein
MEAGRTNGQRGIVERSPYDELVATLRDIIVLPDLRLRSISGRNGQTVSSSTSSFSQKTDNNRSSSKRNESTAPSVAGHDETSVKQLCHKTWAKFSEKHQESPSRSNNNVQFSKNPLKRLPLRFLDSGPEIQTGVVCQEPSKKPKERDDLENTDEIFENHRNVIDKQCSNITSSNILAHRIFLLLIQLFSWLKLITIILLTLVVVYGVLALHKPSQAFISRNAQDYIYPFMRAMRLISIPVVRKFPRITGRGNHIFTFAYPSVHFVCSLYVPFTFIKLL